MNYKVLNRLISPLVKILWPTKIINKDKLIKDEAVIYVCNHYSTMDTNPIYAHLLKDHMNVLIKNEAFKGKFANWFLTSLGGIPVKRGEADLNAVKKVIKALNKNQSVLIYPEGTRNEKDAKVLLDFKTGPCWFAITQKVKIQPLMLYKSPKLFKKNYLIVEDALDLSKYYDKDINKDKITATQELYNYMTKLRYKLDILVDGKKVKIKQIKG